MAKWGVGGQSLRLRIITIPKLMFQMSRKCQVLCSSNGFDFVVP